MTSVGGGHQIQLEALQSIRGDATPHVRNGSGTGNDLQSLMATRQKIRAPGLRSGIRNMWRQHDERGEVAGLCTESLTDPRTDAGPGKRPGPGVDSQSPLVVFRVIRFHRADHAQFVGDVAYV